MKSPREARLLPLGSMRGRRETRHSIMVPIAVSILIGPLISPPAVAETVLSRDALSKLTAEILNPQIPATALRQQVVAITNILHRHGTLRFDEGVPLDAGETQTLAGRALSPAMAARCAEDAARTVTFIRGLHAAIESVRGARPNRVVRVLYVGSGPYALLATPLMTQFDSGQLRVTVLDIHEPSVKSARAVIDGLGLSAWIERYVVADALGYEIDADAPPDVIVMEIMTAALESEPQVAITRHLLAQSPSTIVVPERIEIDAYLVDTASEFGSSVEQRMQNSESRVRLGPVFELSSESVAAWRQIGNERLPAAPIALPDVIPAGYQPMLYTTIRTFGTITLHPYESGLTMPRALSGSNPIAPGKRLGMFYQLGPSPGLVMQTDGVPEARE